MEWFGYFDEIGILLTGMAAIGIRIPFKKKSKRLEPLITKQLLTMVFHEVGQCDCAFRIGRKQQELMA